MCEKREEAKMKDNNGLTKSGETSNFKWFETIFNEGKDRRHSKRLQR